MNTRYKNFILSVGLALLTATATALAQPPAPKPSPANGSGTEERTLASSFEFGYRGLKLEGDRDKYRSDLNYRAGFRLFDSSLYMEDHSSGRKLFDSALLQFSGFGSDPQGSARFSAGNTGNFKVDTSFRRVTYFNNLKNHAVAWSQAIPTGSEHKILNAKHEFGDIDFILFPESENFKLKFGYSFNKFAGPGSWTIRWPSLSGITTTGVNTSIRGDEFMTDNNFKSKANDLRLGVEGKVLGFRMGLDYGRREFRDRTDYLVNKFNIGNDPANPTVGYLNLFSRGIRTKGDVNWGHYYVNRTFANKLDFTGRFIYSSAVTKPKEIDFGSGAATSPGNTIVDSYISAYGGRVKRPQSRADIGLTYRPTDRFRVSNTFTFDQFNNTGAQQSYEEIARHLIAGTPAQPNVFLNAFIYRADGYRKLSDLIEGDFQVSSQFAFHVGYRYTKRRVIRSNYNVNNGVVSYVGGEPSEELENTTNTVILGAKIKPTKNWAIYADMEKGKNDNVFIRLANNDVFNFRVRSRTSWNKLSLNFAAIVKDNEAEGDTTPIAGTSGLASTPTIARTRSQLFSADIGYAASSSVTFNAGYTYNHLKSDADIIVPLGAPLFTTTTFVLGRSEYYVRDSYFFVDVSARLAPRVSLYAAYRIDDDKGQGGRIATRPQDIITGYPIRFTTPEVKMTFKINRNIDWNVGYQYYSYNETPYFNPFIAVTYPNAPSPYLYSQTYPAQNYKAHMPYTSLRIYFGGRASDRLK